MTETILFGITGGLLTLVGLIAIFTSLSTQHNVEKAKEIISTLQTFSVDNRDINQHTSEKLRIMLHQYKQYIKFNLPTVLVVFLAIITIFITGYFWSIFISGMVEEPVLSEKIEIVEKLKGVEKLENADQLANNSINFINDVLIVALIILFLFCALLSMMLFITFLGKLPRFKELNNINYNNRDIDMGMNIAVSTKLLMEVHTDSNKLVVKNIRLRFPVKGIQDVKVHCRITLNNQVCLKSEQFSAILDNGEETYEYGFNQIIYLDSTSNELSFFRTKKWT
ncbi:MAG: hypothetical protein ABGX20_18790 [Bacillus sp. (in: firmicutes)]